MSLSENNPQGKKNLFDTLLPIEFRLYLFLFTCPYIVTRWAHIIKSVTTILTV